MIDLWFMFFCWVGIGYIYFWNFSVQFEIRWSAANQKRMMFVCFFRFGDLELDSLPGETWWVRGANAGEWIEDLD